MTVAELLPEVHKVAETETPHVWVHPGRLSGEPCIGGHRIPTRMVAEYVWEGFTEEGAALAWLLTRDEVLVACWFEARYGRRRAMRKHWKAWLAEHEGDLWHSKPSDWAKVPLPPAGAA